MGERRPRDPLLDGASPGADAHTLGRGEGGLPTPSVAKCEQVTTLARADLEPEAMGPPLTKEKMDAVELALLRALGIDPLALERHLLALLDLQP